MILLELHDRMKQRINNLKESMYSPGYVGRIFEYNSEKAKNESGELPVIIKPEPEDKKKKKFIN